MDLGVVPLGEIWEEIERVLNSGTSFPYPVAVGLSKLSSGNFWTKSGLMIPNGFWTGEGYWPGAFSPGDAPFYTGTNSEYAEVVSEDFVLPARVTSVSGHAFAACYFVFSGDSESGDSAMFRINAQFFKIDSSGNVTLLGTAAAGAPVTVNSLDFFSTYLSSLPFCQELEIDENFRMGMRITLEAKRMQGTGQFSIGWNFHIFNSYSGLLLRSYALLPIKR